MITRFPYNKIEMITALHNASDEEMDRWKQNKEFIAKMTEANSKFIGGDAAINKNVAEYHGITVEELLASPHIWTLEEDYALFEIKKLIEDTRKILQVDDVVAHAIIVQAVGLLD